MKRNALILVAVAAIVLGGCNKKPETGSAATPPPAKTEQADSVVTGPDMSLAEGYQPDADPAKEAAKLAKQTIDLSRRMINGEDVSKEQRKLDALIRLAGDTYKQKGEEEQFQSALNTAIAKEVSTLSAEVKAQELLDSAKNAKQTK